MTGYQTTAHQCPKVEDIKPTADKSQSVGSAEPIRSGEVPMKFILGSIPNGAGTTVLWFCGLLFLFHDATPANI